MKKFGLIGEKLDHSLSPQLHRCFGTYEFKLYPLKPEALESFLRQGEFDGLNVTIPYKQRVIPFCTEISEAARRIGSVNTLIKRIDGTLQGDNTDAFGFAEMARQAQVSFAGKTVLVLGSGGTSRTVCAVVEGAGGKAIVISRQGENPYATIASHREATVLVNTTPVGMYPHMEEAPVDLAELPGLEAVLDVVYNPLRTRLRQQAQALGLRHGGGLPMLIYQAAKASELFTGLAIEEEQCKLAMSTMWKTASNLVLIGMPGCGKTTVGTLLAKKLSWPLVDIDEEIEMQCGLSIAKLFQEEGEEGFRRREEALLRQYGREGGQVLVTGGGAVLSAQNREALRWRGYVVHLTRALHKLPLKGRPLSADRAALQVMWNARRPLYEACRDVAIPNETTPEDCARQIVEAFDEAACG